MSASSGTRKTGVEARSNLGRNLITMLLWQAGNYVVPLATFPYLTRVLGPGEFGTLSFATALATYASVFVDWGFNLTGPAAAVRCRNDPRALNELIWSTVLAKGMLCVVSLAVLMLYFRLGQLSPAFVSIAVCAWLSVIANMLSMSWLLQGLERFGSFATLSLAGRFLTLPLTFMLVTNTSDTMVAAAIQSAAAITTSALSFVFVWKIGAIDRPVLSWRAIRSTLAGGAHNFLSTASVTLFGATNAVLLASMAGTHQAGLYAAADKMRIVGNIVPAQINTVLYPRALSLFREDRRAAAKLTVIGAIATLLTTALGVAIATTCADLFTRIVLGHAFTGSGDVLRLLCFATVFGNLAYFFGLQVLVPFQLEGLRSRVMLAAGCANIALAWLLIPRFGALGAAASYLAAEAFIFVAYAVALACIGKLRAHFTQLHH